MLDLTPLFPKPVGRTSEKKGPTKSSAGASPSTSNTTHTPISNDDPCFYAWEQSYPHQSGNHSYLICDITDSVPQQRHKPHPDFCKYALSLVNQSAAQLNEYRHMTKHIDSFLQAERTKVERSEGKFPDQSTDPALYSCLSKACDKLSSLFGPDMPLSECSPDHFVMGPCEGCRLDSKPSIHKSCKEWKSLGGTIDELYELLEERDEKKLRNGDDKWAWEWLWEKSKDHASWGQSWSAHQASQVPTTRATPLANLHRLVSTCFWRNAYLGEAHWEAGLAARGVDPSTGSGAGRRVECNA